MGEGQKRKFDIIGDVHGYASKLQERLGELGYEESAGVYRHPERTAVFVGDLVDRGPEQLWVLEIVKAMVDAGSAEIVMGNHEFNAIAFANNLREHNEKHIHQHEAFLGQLSAEQQKYYIDWFWTIPLWLDLGGLRVVHACWHEPSMNVLGSDRLTGMEQLVAATTKGHPVYEAVEILLKGPRSTSTSPTTTRTAIVADGPGSSGGIPDAKTLREIAVLDGNFTNAAGDPYPELPDTPVSDEDRAYVYTDTVPLVYGHYWRQGTPGAHRRLDHLHRMRGLQRRQGRHPDGLPLGR